MRGFIFMLIKDRKADVMGKEFLLGELTVSLINTPQEQMDKIFEVMLELENSVFMQYCTYPFIPCKPYIPITKKPKRAVMIDDITEADKLLRKAYDLIKSVDVCKSAFPIGPLEHQELDGISIGSEEYMKLVASYSQYFNVIYCTAYDLTTMYGYCREFADDLVIRLDALNTSELSRAYEYIAFPDECRFSIDSLLDPLDGEYQLGDSMILQYIPMSKDDSDEWYIAEYFRFDTLQGLLKTDFVRGLMKGHFPRKCEHCGRYFLMTKGYHTRFCDMPSPEAPTMTCRQAAYKKVRDKERSKDDPKYQSYQRCRKRINTAFTRGSIGEKEKASLLSTLEDLYFEACSSPKYSNEEFEQLLDSERLYTLCANEQHPDDIVYRKWCKLYTRELFEQLSMRERYIIGSHYGIFGYKKMTDENIGKMLTKTRDAVMKDIEVILKKLREMYYDNSNLYRWRKAHWLVWDEIGE